jgi:hypothetical protein
MRPFLIVSVGVGLLGLLLWRLRQRAKSSKPIAETSRLVPEESRIISEPDSTFTLDKKPPQAQDSSAEQVYCAPAEDRAQGETTEHIDRQFETQQGLQSRTRNGKEGNAQPHVEQADFAPPELSTQLSAELKTVSEKLSNTTEDGGAGSESESAEALSELLVADPPDVAMALPEGIQHEEAETDQTESQLSKPSEDARVDVEALLVANVTPNSHASPKADISTSDPLFISSDDTDLSPRAGASSVSAEPELLRDTEVADRDEKETSPARYRPPTQRPARVSSASAERRPRVSGYEEVLLRIRVRLLFDSFGFCQIGLLPERSSGLDDDVLVRFGGQSLRLVAQEDWYQDIQLDGLSAFLRNSLELKGRLADSRRIRWLLTGRDFYVLANQPRGSGFISTDRLLLGRWHVVLCCLEALPEVEAILSEAGCTQYVKLDETYGVPSGWVALREVFPTKPIALSAGSDPFYAIKPAPDIDIQLDGGVCLRNSVWLAGYPPRIQLSGQFDNGTRVIIDDHEAHVNSEGGLVVNGYDDVGSHSVYCEGLSCSASYSIEEPTDSWVEWDAYRFGGAEICGPLAHSTLGSLPKLPFAGPMTNLLLLGARPGQIFHCSPRRFKCWKGFVPFEVVWALPTDALRCDKRVARVLDHAALDVGDVTDLTASVKEWSKAIRDASRKGLRLEHESVDIGVRWKEYKKVAKQIWKASR